MLKLFSFNIIAYILVTIFQSLFFIEYIKKVSFFDKHSKIKENIGVISFVLFNCLSYVFLSSVDQRIPNVLFVVSCVIYCMIFNLNNIVENLILSFIFYSAIWSIGYSCNNLEHKLDSLGIIWVYITTVINLIITYLVVTKVVTRFVNFKPNNSFNNF